LKHGIGRNVINKCGIYEGQWHKDKAHGFGRAINEMDLTVFEGYYQNGFENGEGKIQYRNGKVKYGLWEDGKFNGAN
jgi:hypothetical protein